MYTILSSLPSATDVLAPTRVAQPVFNKADGEECRFGNGPKNIRSNMATGRCLGLRDWRREIAELDFSAMFHLILAYGPRFQQTPMVAVADPDCLADEAKPLWSEDLVPRGVMSDHPKAAANAALMLLHSNVVKSRIDGRCKESQSWPVSFDVMVSCLFIESGLAR